MAGRVDPKHLAGLLGTAGKAIAAMPEGKRVVDEVRRAATRDDLLFVLRSADLGLDDPAADTVRRAAADAKHWEEVKATLLRSAELQLTERYSSNA